MTQIRSMAQPVQRRPGELGVHSLDHFVLAVPDLKPAQGFYESFGLNLRADGNALARGNGQAVADHFATERVIEVPTGFQGR